MRRGRYQVALSSFLNLRRCLPTLQSCVGPAEEIGLTPHA